MVSGMNLQQSRNVKESGWLLPQVDSYQGVQKLMKLLVYLLSYPLVFSA